MIEPYYQNDLVTLYKGDCLEIMPVLDNRANLIVTSPPYYNAREYSYFETYNKYLDFMESFVDGCFNSLIDGGIFAINTSPVLVKRKSRNDKSKRFPIPFDIHALTKDLFDFLEDIVWKKPLGSGSGRGKHFAYIRKPLAYHPESITEYIIIYQKHTTELMDKFIHNHPEEIIRDSLVENDYEMSNVWEICPERNRNHNAVFPIILSQNLIRYYSYLNDIVLDPFAGSGTTGVAAMNLNRKCVLIEKEEKYCDITVQRLKDTEKQIAERLF